MKFEELSKEQKQLVIESLLFRFTECCVIDVLTKKRIADTADIVIGLAEEYGIEPGEHISFPEYNKTVIDKMTHLEKTEYAEIKKFCTKFLKIKRF